MAWSPGTPSRVISADIVEALKRDRKLFLVSLGLGFNAHGNNRFRECRGLKAHFVVAVAKGVSSDDILGADDCADCAAVSLFDVFALVGLDDEEARNALRLVAARVVNLHALLNAAAVNADEHEFAGKWVGPKLEREGRGGRIVVRNDFQRRLVFVAFGIRFNRRNVERAGEVVDDGIHEHLHALVLERGTGDDAHEFAGHRGLADRRADFVGFKVRLAFEEALHDIVVEVSDGFNKLVPVLFGLFLVLGGDFDFVELHALEVGRIVHIRLHLHEVDEASELVFSADGQEERMRVAVELALDVFNRAVEVGTRAVHLVDERYAGDVVLVHLAPNRFGLGLYAADRAENCDSAIEHAERTFDFSSEVNVSGGVDKVELLFDARVGAFLRGPVAADGRRRDGDAAFAFLFHPVGYRRAFVHFADLVDDAAVEQNSFGAGCLAGVDVRGNTDVSRIFQRLRSVG